MVERSAANVRAPPDRSGRETGLGATLARLPPLPLDADGVVRALRDLVAVGGDVLPQPGGGHTWQRWAALARVAATDLSLLKLYEGHTDALAILAELGERAAPGTWGVWAAEVPGIATRFERDGAAEGGRLTGRKGWCSGADGLDFALVTTLCSDGTRVLVQVALDQPGVACRCDGWRARAMAATHTGEVTFDGARAKQVGGANAYLERPGFWHGSAGIAACWYGAACAIAQSLRRSPRIERDPHAQAHLGAVDAQLFAAHAALHAVAEAIDAAPAGSSQVAALRVRIIVEAAASATLARVGRALGAAPLCADAVHAQRCADLTTFLRQSHAESDWQVLGTMCAGDDGCLADGARP